MRPIFIAEALKGFEGKWVALKSGEVVAAKETPDALRLFLHEHDIDGTSMMRVPDKDEPELVGFG